MSPEREAKRAARIAAHHGKRPAEMVELRREAMANRPQAPVPEPVPLDLPAPPDVSAAAYEAQAARYRAGPSDRDCAAALRYCAEGCDYAHLSSALGLVWHFTQGWLDQGDRDLAEGQVCTVHARFAAAVQHGRRVYDEALVRRALSNEAAGLKGAHGMLTRHLETRRPEYRLGRVRTREAEVAGAPSAPTMEIPEPTTLDEFGPMVETELARARRGD